MGSSEVVGFTRERAGVPWVHVVHLWRRWVHPGSLSSLLLRSRGRWVHPGSLSSFVFVLGNVECISGRRVHPVSFGSLGCVLGVVGFIRVRWVISGSTWVHPGSLSSLELALEVVEFIRGRCVRSGSSLGLFGSLGVVWCIQVRPGSG